MVYKYVFYVLTYCSGLDVKLYPSDVRLDKKKDVFVNFVLVSNFLNVFSSFNKKYINQELFRNSLRLTDCFL